MGLQEQIDKMRPEIRSDHYSMSIGEWISLYEDESINLHPEFQSFFRWTSSQKTRLIESILLGIPIPPIFVAQREDGVWDIVDGLNRLSTIYELIGKLKDEHNNCVEPLILEGTKYLPDLAGKKWEDNDNPQNSLTQNQRLLIKRAKIDVTIILEESDDNAKYELFQRLNTGGSIATVQEVRNCILVMNNQKMFHWMKKLSQSEIFKDCVGLSEKSIAEQYDMELLLKFLVFRNLEADEIRNISNNFNEFLTDKMIELSENPHFDYSEAEMAFNKTFEILNEQMGIDSFRRYSPTKDKFLGGFLVSAYEFIALGIGYNYKTLSNSPINVREKVKQFWIDPENPIVSSQGWSNANAQRRMIKLIPLGRKLFQP